MKTFLMMIVTMAFLIGALTAMPVAADQRRHHDGYENERNHGVSSYRGEHDHGRYGKQWRGDRHEERYWKKQRRHRHVASRPAPRVVYKPFMGPIVYLPRTLLLPPRSLTVGGPDLRFRISW